MPIHANPTLFQINTRVLLAELSARLGRPATLHDLPEDLLDRIEAQGFDWVWLLGVWQTGTIGLEIAQINTDIRPEMEAAIPDMTVDDICSSPFSVQSYTVNREFGGTEALREVRARLSERGILLLLDFVPNHVAPDNPWVETNPSYFIEGTETDLEEAPKNYARLKTGDGERILAYGRDPYFAGWSDTLQLNYRDQGLQQAMQTVLHDIATQCDGVRCDMAMLVVPEVFMQTWGEKSNPVDGSAPTEESFWPNSIQSVRKEHPDFVFMAEVYWDMEWNLQQLGFDYTYDKKLYDRLREQDAPTVYGHLGADMEFQKRSVRFLENHDEPRAASAFPLEVHKAAAVISFLIPGLRFFHQGQLQGRRARIPMQLGRAPVEGVDKEINNFYLQLLGVLRAVEVREGQWGRLECRGAWHENPTYSQFIALTWTRGASRILVVVNYGPRQGQCFVKLPFAEWENKAIELRDLMGPETYQRDGNELAMSGLYLDLPAWGYHVFSCSTHQ